MPNKLPNESKISSVIAREGNGNIQITFTVPFAIIEKAKEETISEMAKDIEVPGFRKGKAPLNRVKENIPDKKVLEHALGHILPAALADAIRENNLKLVIYPKFELISAEDDKDWQIRGTSCELPPVELGDYKKVVSGALRAGSIITPDKLKGGESKTPDQLRSEKEQAVIKAIIETTKVDIPEILITEEADGRLSSLLERIEKLGLTLEGYLASIKKTPEDIRAEYAAQAKSAIAIDLILSKVAEVEGIKVTESEVNEAFKLSEASQAGKTENTDDRKRLIESILARRKALDFLTNLS